MSHADTCYAADATAYVCYVIYAVTAASHRRDCWHAADATLIRVYVMPLPPHAAPPPPLLAFHFR